MPEVVPLQKPRAGNRKLASLSFLLTQQPHDPLDVFLGKGSQRPVHASGVPVFPSDESSETGSQFI